MTGVGLWAPIKVLVTVDLPIPAGVARRLFHFLYCFLVTSFSHSFLACFTSFSIYYIYITFRTLYSQSFLPHPTESKLYLLSYFTTLLISYYFIVIFIYNRFVLSYSNAVVSTAPD